MTRPLEIGMTLLVEETNQTHKVNWTPWKIHGKHTHAEPNAYARSEAATKIRSEPWNLETK